jgi:hypothetical protein
MNLRDALVALDPASEGDVDSLTLGQWAELTADGPVPPPEHPPDPAPSLLPPRPVWQASANCRGLDPDLTAYVPILGRNSQVRAHAIVDEEDAVWLGRWNWRLHRNGYAWRGRKIGGRVGQYFTILMHRVILDLPHGCPFEVDHRNGDRLDNRKANLRICTHAENGQNQPGRNGTRGVSWHEARGMWRARVTLEGRERALGYFDSKDEARAAVIAWRAKHMPFATERGA